ncbi:MULTISPECIES: amino acid adenylation domain-containing protein [unclassified Halomonas]|uniref:non-ribosomal peptide synthetase n=1 Tax=unclassified Halomonas TaxID=2609666 RepID=UPI0007D8FB9B|nr:MULTISPECIES: amino acid adenylation domain-containing protein [unclassified Halomonas]MBT2787102.1 amino acid adenylation domain-containing protein [Halomonas sp. ISL-106]MBT2795444.1 amino acid adenylation domain-containing protein [Halomonas sp. ISL-104]OAL57949.1 non-ribosomal peptide synthetase [Halomonas sp. ALS9]
MNAITEQQNLAHWPLSPEQRAVLVAAEANASDTQQAALAQANVMVVDIQGALDSLRLEQALSDLRQQHEALSTALKSVAGYRGLRHQALENLPAIEWRNEDLRGSDDEEALLNDVRDYSEALKHRPMAIERGELVRPALLRTGETTWVLVLAVSALVADRGSLQSLFSALVEAYGQSGGADDESALQYSQFIEWRASLENDDDAEEGREYWQRHQQHAEQAGACRLPARQANRHDMRAEHEYVACQLEADLVARIDSLADELQVSAEAVLQAAWWALLTRISGNESVIGGWQHDCRQDYEVMQGAIGLFDKVLPVLVEGVADSDFSSWIARLAEQLEAHTQAQEYWSIDALPDKRHLAVGFAFSEEVSELKSAGLQWRLREVPGPSAEFELALHVGRSESGAVATLYTDPSRYSRAAAECLLDQFQTLLQAGLADPAQKLFSVPLISPEQQQGLLTIEDNVLDLGERSVATHIAAWAASTSDAIAIEEQGRTLSYTQLEARTNGIAGWLDSQGVKHGDYVALNLPRSTDLVVLLLAVWRVGAAYLPLDPEWPVERKRRVLEDAQPALVVSTEYGEAELAALAFPGIRSLGLPREVEGAGSSALPFPEPDLSDVAYLLYTSGSTGTPKGVVIEHGQLLNYVAGATKAMGLSACQRWALTGSLATDLGNTALFGALFNGARLVIAAPDDMQDGDHFARFMSATNIDALKIVPSHLEALLECEAPQLPKTLILGGEAASPTLLSSIARISPECQLYNHYGPTEATVGVMVHPVSLSQDIAGPLPLTQLLPNCRYRVLDDNLHATPTGAVGELYLGGAQLASGYLNSDASAFVEDPFIAGERLYRTGDLACVLPEGGVRLIGRADDQIKLRGFRIEPAEIESVLQAQPGVKQSLVRLMGRGADTQELVAFLIGEPEAMSAEGQTQLREQLTVLLPEPMCPSRFIPVEHFPRLGNGKVDTSALEAVAQKTAKRKTLVKPRDAVEANLCQAMTELLGRDEIGIDDDFFELGGHSLLVIKLVARIRKQFGIEIAPGVVFDHPTAAELGAALRESEYGIQEETHPSLSIE